MSVVFCVTFLVIIQALGYNSVVQEDPSLEALVYEHEVDKNIETSKFSDPLLKRIGDDPVMYVAPNYDQITLLNEPEGESSGESSGESNGDFVKPEPRAEISVGPTEEEMIEMLTQDCYDMYKICKHDCRFMSCTKCYQRVIMCALADLIDYKDYDFGAGM